MPALVCPLSFRPFILPFEHMTRSQHHINRCVQHEVKRSFFLHGTSFPNAILRHETSGRLFNRL